ncbi:MAG TPA: helix-turn-helix transcriptional regulator [Solirubrobacterales bacterium]|nr:helix-turn-helix transcriptional regulator [Solirubrobacterales bacterium]
MDKQAVAERLAENLSRYRAASGLSQEELATRASIHRTQVSELLHGKQVPRVDTLVKLAGALEIEPVDLLEGIRFEPAVSEPGEFKITPGPKR